EAERPISAAPSPSPPASPAPISSAIDTPAVLFPEEAAPSEPRRPALASSPSPLPVAPPDAGAAQQSNAANAAGIAAYEAGRYREALDAFEQAMARQPDHPVIRHNAAAAMAALGWAAVEARDADEAIRQFRAAAELDRTEASFYAGLGAAYQLRGEPQRAVDALRAAVALAPDQGELYEELAELLYQRNQLDETISVLTMGVERARHPERLSASLARVTREQSVQGRFLQTGTRHFTIQFDGGENRETAYLVLDLLELAYRDVGQALTTFPDDDIIVILYNNEQFRDITQTPGWTKGVYDGKIRLPVGGHTPDRHTLAKVIYHEYTHLVVRELAGDRTPTWLNEGLAVYLEHLASGNLEAARGAADRPGLRLTRSALRPLPSLHGSFLGYSTEQAAAAYAQSYDAARFLIDRYGLHRVRELLAALSSARPFEAAFEATFFLTYADFERLWRETVAS
ncbi:MAG: tetratricopeptide repeat protein, partial [Nitrospirota bacterium]